MRCFSVTTSIKTGKYHEKSSTSLCIRADNKNSKNEIGMDDNNTRVCPRFHASLFHTSVNIFFSPRFFVCCHGCRRCKTILPSKYYSENRDSSEYSNNVVEVTCDFKILQREIKIYATHHINMSI